MAAADIAHLSDVFRFVYSFGQKGHQIGRKIGDAVELITYGAIDLVADSAAYLVIEPGVEGATSAEHKVEFAFYNVNGLGMVEDKTIGNLFGIIECKKVGVEQTVKQSFKEWASKNKGPFQKTKGYCYSVNPRWAKAAYAINIVPAPGPMLTVEVKLEGGKTTKQDIKVQQDDRIAIALDVTGELHVVAPGESLSDIKHSLASCVVATIKSVSASGVETVIVDDCLKGPQTPEKAKQASFVSLDVRKRITGSFDRPIGAGARPFTSILVIGEASHWEAKSRSMVRLCNDYNLVVPDEVVIEFFKEALHRFGDKYQTLFRKNHYIATKEMRDCVRYVIDKFNHKVLMDMDSGTYVVPPRHCH